jgi:polyisoprenoid-binding protein YceI
MAIQAGTYTLGHATGTLTVRTKRTGAAAKAGHDLVIDVTAWEATLEVGDAAAESSLVLEADATSLRVREGKGGMQSLDDDDKANIEQTIDEEVLKAHPISFRSTTVEVAADGSGINVEGELTIAGATAPIAFDVTVAPDGALACEAVVTQSDWGITPYSTLFGTLKVVDDVEVALDARLPG